VCAYQHPINANSGFICLLRRGDQFLFRSPFCSLASLLDRIRQDRRGRKCRSHFQMEKRPCIREESRCCRYRWLSFEGCGLGVVASACDRQECTFRKLASWSCSPACVSALWGDQQMSPLRKSGECLPESAILSSCYFLSHVG
jgi:hypothetical protein